MVYSLLGCIYMSKIMWTIEEEQIVCKFYLENLNCSQWIAKDIYDAIVEAGYKERSISSIQAKLRDYSKIHNNGNITHVAPKSIRVYKKATRKSTYAFEGVDEFIHNLRYTNVTSENSNSNNSNTTNFVFNGKTARSFSELFFELLDRDGRKNSDIYNSVGLSRQDFSKIMSGKSRSIENLILLSIALKLDYPTAIELMSLARVALDPSDDRDAIIIYALQKRIYDTFEIDEALEKRGLPTLFSEY